MNNDYIALKNDLLSLGLSRGECVLIHSSYKSMGNVEGGIETLINAILAVIGDSGTLIAPTLSFKTVTPGNPVFDYLKTPSCVGAVSEYVRNMDGAIRSIHPTHSCVAIGREAELYTKGHENDRTPAGENSPFYKLMHNDGKILMLGCGTNCNTSFHAIEEIAKAPYALTGEPITHTLILPDRVYTADYRRHTILQNGFAQRYLRISQVLDPKYMPCGCIHGAESYLFSAGKMMEVALSAMKQNAYYFVSKEEK